MNNTISPSKKKHLFYVKETKTLILYDVLTLIIVIAACVLKQNYLTDETWVVCCEIYANVFSAFCGSISALICGRFLDSKDYPKTQSEATKRRNTKSVMHFAYAVTLVIVTLLVLVQFVFPVHLRWIYNVALYGLCSAAIGLSISMVERMLHFEAEDAKRKK